MSFQLAGFAHRERKRERRTGFKRERGDVDDDLGARLEDDEEHADGAGDAVELEVVVQRARVGDGACWVG